MIEVAIAEDHTELRLTLRLLLNYHADLSVVCECENGLQAVECVKKFAPDVLITDLHMPEVDGLEAARQIQALEVKTRIILISSEMDLLSEADLVVAGVHGFVLKDKLFECLYPAIRAAASGETFFGSF